MEATIKRTNSGDMYIVLEADKNNIEELMDLTEFRKRTMIKTNELINFGGGAAMFGRNKDKHLDYTLNIMIREEN